VDVDLAPAMRFLATPNLADPSAWANHFYSADDLLNRVWYGCGYTTQMCVQRTSARACRRAGRVPCRDVRVRASVRACCVRACVRVCACVLGRVCVRCLRADSYLIRVLLWHRPCVLRL
jgi:hypothetical protein